MSMDRIEHNIVQAIVVATRFPSPPASSQHKEIPFKMMGNWEVKNAKRTLCNKIHQLKSAIALAILPIKHYSKFAHKEYAPSIIVSCRLLLDLDAI